MALTQVQPALLDFSAGFTSYGNIAVSVAGTGGQISVTNSSDSDRGFIARTASGKIQVGTNSSIYDFELVIDGLPKAKLDTAGNFTLVTAAGLGYGTGSGGTVTQLTSKATAVTLNKPTGQIVTSNSALGAAARTSFVVNNSLVAPTDTIVLTPVNNLNYTITAAAPSASGSFQIVIKNETGGSLSEAISINFAIIKGATA